MLLLRRCAEDLLCQGPAAVEGLPGSSRRPMTFGLESCQLGLDVHKGNATQLLETFLLGYRCAAPATTGRSAATKAYTA